MKKQDFMHQKWAFLVAIVAPDSTFYQKRVHDKRCVSHEANEFTRISRFRVAGGVMAILADFRIAGLDILIGARQPSKFTGLTRITSFCVHPFFEELWF
jgi:hypothetical protein